MADQRSGNQLEQQSEAWIDSIKRALDAQTELFVTALRFWRRLGTGVVQASSGVAERAAQATTRGATEAASDATGAASTESLDEALAAGTRRARQETDTARQEARERTAAGPSGHV